MKKNEAIVKRQAARVRFDNKDMDFLFNWMIGAGSIVGLSHGELFGVVDGMRDGDPDEWRDRFERHGDFLVARAAAEEGASAAQDRMAAAFCYRAVLHYVDPTGAEYTRWVERMESEFQRGVRGLGIPMRPIEVPFEGKTLPGYLLEHDEMPRPFIFMVGGGDSYREDLYYFAGYPAWKRGYNAIMVDLPGQGACPSRGLTFRADMAAPISASLDFLHREAACPAEKTAIYGVSGGGYFTAQAAASDRRIGAWVASTPITDIAEVFRREFGAVTHVPGWFTRLAARIAGAVNKSADLTLKKYAWQLGSSDLRSAIEEIYLQARPVESGQISCPCLFLVGAGEADELKRQSEAIVSDLKIRSLNVTLRRFSAAEGDIHCQLSNLRLAHSVVFDWLDEFVFPPPAPVDPRLLAW
jgi:hypothetical protein